MTSLVTVNSYNYNTNTKEINQPETVEVNKHNVVRIEAYRRPYINEETFYQAHLTDRYNIIITEADRDKLRE